MAKRKKRKTRRQMWFMLFLVLSVGISFGVAAIVANVGGGFNTTLFFVLALCLSVVFLALYIVLSIPSVKGRMGEGRVNSVLESLSKTYGGCFIHDVIIPGENGKTSQIDHVYVCSRGVFVIETKNYTGRIYGSDEQKQWTQVLAYGNTKNKLYNPVKQNWTHIHRLQDVLPEKVDMVNVVVFVQGNIEYIDSPHVYDLRGLKQLVAESEEIYDNEKDETIAKAILAFKENPVSTSKVHIASIKEKQRGIREGVCPRCGGELVLRTSKKDGREFIGCSNYPKCKFTKDVG